jgi:hypothetical protein
MELPTREEIAHGGSGHVDTVGVTGSNPVSRTISHLCAATIYTFPSESQGRDCNPFRLGLELANVLVPLSDIGIRIIPGRWI